MDMVSARQAFQAMTGSNDIGSHDRFVATALEWLGKRGPVTVEWVGDSWVVKGQSFCSGDDSLADTLSGAVHCCVRER